MRIHVCIVSDALLANLLPALAHRPDRAYLVATRAMRSKAEALQRLLDRDGLAATIVDDAFDGRWPDVVQSAQQLADRIADDAPGAEVTLNVTGGTKPMAVGFMLGFRDLPHRIIYVDMRHGVINHLGRPAAPDERLPNLLDVRRYLGAAGFHIDTIDSDAPDWRQRVLGQRRVLHQLAARVTSARSLLNKLRLGEDAGEQADEDWRPGTGRSVECLIHAWEVTKHERLLRALADHGVIDWSPSAGTRVRIPAGQRSAFLNGHWLEHYAYAELEELGLFDLAIGVDGRWGSGPASAGVQNEFDVIAVHANRLLFIECKIGTMRATKEANKLISEVEALGKRGGGQFGSVLLLSAATLPDAARERARQSGVHTLCGKEIRTLRGAVAKWMRTGRLE